MRREKRKSYDEKDNLKTILVLSGGGLLLAIITFIVVFAMYNNKLNSDTMAGTNVSKISNLTNSTGEITNNLAQAASSEMGKTVNEVKKENNTTNQNTVNSQNSQLNTANTNTMEKNTNNSGKDIKNNIATNKKAEVAPPKVEEKEPTFQMPVTGELLREYAKDTLVYSDTLKEWVTHLGIDIKAEKTTVVKASSDGIVESIKNDPRYGLTVTIKHSKGYKTIYSNLLTTEFIKQGENVKNGQSIATVGNSAAFEVADEPHLHFEILKDNVKVDPKAYLK